MNPIDASVIIVSFNTKALLKRCFDSIRASAGDLRYEVIVVDNGSKDGSADFVRTQYPEYILLETGENLGFAGANNLGYQKATGRYTVLLNSDAFFVGSAFVDSVKRMDQQPEVGLGGVKLTGEDGSWQPSARTFPSLWNEWVMLTGLSSKFPQHRWFGRPDLTYLDQNADTDCDWVPGAFSVIRKQALDQVGFFDERFFLYFEEVDLCRRIQKAGWKIRYWADLRVIHIGGASTSVFSAKLVSKSGMQMGLWRLQSQYLYYRKQHGWWTARLSKALEASMNSLRLWRNKKKNPQKAEESRVLLDLMKRAWKNTKAGSISPPRPWQGV